MAPTRAQESSGDYEKEYNEFLEKLAAYHEKRGTHLETEPRVGTKQIDLLQLFKTVVERGGYDKVSDEKLAWRKLGQDFNLPSNNLPALAFGLKTIYYKNLAAYEISTIHGKEPPPKEILEEVTAKGGALLTRTLENYRPSSRRELGNEQSDSGEEGTPDRNRHDSEETPGSGGRVTRGLRQAPPQRVLFQPDTLPSRQSRHAPQPVAGSLQQPSRASSTHNPAGSETMSSALANYEPRPSMPLTVRPVVTPGNNPAEFIKRQRALQQAQNAQNLAAASKINPRIMLPGTGFEGPNIYVRCLLSLKSGIKAEQDYALHHLMKISLERGDKFKFESFPGLAEALIEKALEVGSLFYDVNWEIAYPEDGIAHGPHVLDGLEGTPDILQKIAGLSPKDVDDNLQPAEFSDLLLQITEAILTLRNMVILEENSVYTAEMWPLRDLLVIVLNLPKLECTVEIKHYALDLAELITKYLHFDDEDPLYLSLLSQLESDDRGAIVTALHALNRISMNLEFSNRLPNVQNKLLQHIMDWMLLDDDVLVQACLDFFYQYTAVVPNVNQMVKELNTFALVTQLSVLLTHGAKNLEKEQVIKHEFRRAPPNQVPLLPREMIEKLYQMEEPERSSCWLRMLYEEDKDNSITQLAVWQAYQTRFNPAVQAGKAPLLGATDFIRNVGQTFSERAAAQMQPDQQRYIIKGIRIREVPVDLKGRPYTKCKWTLNPVLSNGFYECREHFMTAEQLWEHIMVTHLLVERNEENKLINVEKPYSCLWSGCDKYSTPTPLKTLVISNHIKLHAKAATNATQAKYQSASSGSNDIGINGQVRRPARPSWIDPPVTRKVTYLDIPTDERGDATGIPYGAVLVLRNLARNLPKTEAEEAGLEDRGGVTLVHSLFKPIEAKLWFIFSHCRPLGPYLADILTNYTA